MSIRQLILAASLAAIGAASAQVMPRPAADVRLGDALQAARANLDVGLAREALAAARADVVSADRAPLPVLSLKASQMDLQNGLGPGNALTRKRIDKGLGIDWTWERGQKRELRTLAAQRAADAAQSDLEDTQLLQQLAGLQAFYDLLAAQQRQAEVRLIGQSAQQLAASAARRVQAGDLAAQDAARTEIEAQRAQADMQMADLERERAAATLAQLMGRSVASGLQAVGSWPTAESATVPTDLSELVEARADVRAALARVQSAQAALDNAQALRKSDITWGASLDHYPGTSTRLLELRLQMPLQIGYSYQGEIARAQAALTQAQTALDKTRLTASLELQQLRQTLQSTQERARRFETDILPRARSVADGAELAYAKGAIPLVDLLDARRTLRATVLDAIGARADFARAQGSWQLRTAPGALLTTP